MKIKSINNTAYRISRGPSVQKAKKLSFKDFDDEIKEIAEKSLTIKTLTIDTGELLKDNLSKIDKKKAVAITASVVTAGTILGINKQQRKKNTLHNANIDTNNNYAMQMAQDISSYKYGKHMTGFVNF